MQIDKTKDLRAGMVFERPTIFGSMLKSKLPEREKKNTFRLADEAFGILSAGTEMTSWALSVTRW